QMVVMIDPGRHCEYLLSFPYKMKDRHSEVNGQDSFWSDKEIPRNVGESERKPTKIKGYDFGEVASAMQKTIRASQPREAAFWTMVLWSASPSYTFKRLLICAAED